MIEKINDRFVSICGRTYAANIVVVDEPDYGIYVEITMGRRSLLVIEQEIGEEVIICSTHRTDEVRLPSWVKPRIRSCKNWKEVKNLLDNLHVKSVRV